MFARVSEKLAPTRGFSEGRTPKALSPFPLSNRARFTAQASALPKLATKSRGEHQTVSSACSPSMFTLSATITPTKEGEFRGECKGRCLINSVLLVIAVGIERTTY
jgi:hypothetical protein